MSDPVAPGLAELVASLDELDGKATARPWQTRFMYRLFVRVRESPGDLAFNTDGSNDWNDCEFFVALVNAWPQLRSLASRAEELREVASLAARNDKLQGDIGPMIARITELVRENDAHRARGISGFEAEAIAETRRQQARAESAEAELSRLKAEKETDDRAWRTLSPVPDKQGEKP